MTLVPGWARSRGNAMAVKSYDKLYIGGKWVAPLGTDVISVINPATEEVIATVPDGTIGDIEAAVAAAREAFDHGPWPKMAPAERGAVVAKVAELLMGEMTEMAELITTEMGAPMLFSQMGQVAAPFMVLNYYAGLASTYQFDELRTGALGTDVLVTKEPVGVVGAITPWNVPLFLAVGKLAPALVAGCTVVLKPAP